MSKVRGEVFDYSEAFSRNIGLLSQTEQERVRGARVAIAGLGGVGGNHALALARIGFGSFSLADMDKFELANMNRQVGATIDTLGRILARDPGRSPGSAPAWCRRAVARRMVAMPSKRASSDCTRARLSARGRRKHRRCLDCKPCSLHQ